VALSTTASAPPTLEILGRTLPAYGARFDVSLAAARRAIGAPSDPSNPEHAATIRIWLNQWLCRIGYPRAGEVDVFARSLSDWWHLAASNLPDDRTTLAGLSNNEILNCADAYDDLRLRAASVRSDGAIRSIAPTASAKVCYFLRPLAIPPWDKQIASRFGGVDVKGFASHLTRCRAWARSLVREAAERGLAEDAIGHALGRPESSVAKLIDEWLYMTITRRVEPGSG
jgi:hypothetical protein